MKLILFDIDGTLINAGKAAETAFEVAFEQLFGIKNCWGDVNPHGRTDPCIIREICENALGAKISSNKFDTLCEKYLQGLGPSLENCSNYRVLDGVQTLLSELSKHQDLILGLETGNLQQAAELKLRRGNLFNFFTTGGFGSDSAIRSELVAIAIERASSLAKQKGSTEIQEIYVVGDAPQDVVAGQNNGATTIAVTTGNSSRDDLMKESPDYILDSLLETDSFIEITGLKRKSP